MRAERRLPSCLTDRELRPVCADCHREIKPGEARVTVGNPERPTAPWYRCGDCEYETQLRALRGR